jgi:hypothetical protein
MNRETIGFVLIAVVTSAAAVRSIVVDGLAIFPIVMLVGAVALLAAALADDQGGSPVSVPVVAGTAVLLGAIVWALS